MSWNYFFSLQIVLCITNFLVLKECGSWNNLQVIFCCLFLFLPCEGSHPGHTHPRQSAVPLSHTAYPAPLCSCMWGSSDMVKDNPFHWALRHICFLRVHQSNTMGTEQPCKSTAVQSIDTLTWSTLVQLQTGLLLSTNSSIVTYMQGQCCQDFQFSTYMPQVLIVMWNLILIKS
jgi:hypothetical protein